MAILNAIEFQYVHSWSPQSPRGVHVVAQSREFVGPPPGLPPV
jgi:hypothetical protein